MSVDVLVLGAGLAGLRAAERLREGGASVRVLEARDRVGGRTLLQDIGGVSFDLGAQWIGPTQDRMIALIERLGLTTHRQHTAGRKVLDVRGQVSTYKRSIPSLGPLHLVELERTMRRVDALTARIDPDDPLADPEAVAWDAQTVETYKHTILSQTVRGLVDAMVRVVFGSEASELSLLYFLYYLRLGGGLRRLVESEDGAQQDVLVGGMGQIAPLLAAELGEAVSLSQPVRAVRQDDHGVTVVTDAQTHRAQRVVVAIPPALCGRLAWDPLLPSARDQLTQRMPMASTIKCIAIYDRPFWREAGFSGEVVCDGLPLAVTFDDCSPDGRHFALLGFAVGKGGRQLGALPLAQRRGLVLDRFARWFGEAARSPLAYGDFDWSAEEFTRGCPIGVMQPGAFAMAGATLKAAVGRVHWAGTESADVWTGFMEGALQSGERAAAEVLAAL